MIIRKSFFFGELYYFNILLLDNFRTDEKVSEC